MKKNIMILSALAAVLMLLPSCKKDKDQVIIRSEMKSPSLNNGAKTYLGPTTDGQTPILWDKNDHIGVFDGVNRYEFELESGENTSNARFTTLASPFESNNYCAIYPTGMNPTAELNNDSYTVTFYLPQMQTYQKPLNGIPTLGKGMLPMLAYSSQYHVFNFNTPMAILKVDLIGTGWVNKMVLTDLNEGNKLWGKVSATMSAETDIPEIHSADLSEGGNTLTLNCNHAQLSETPTSFYFVVPVGTLRNEEGFNFKIDVYDLDNVCHTIEKIGVAGGNIQRANITTVAHDEMLELDDITGIKGVFSVGENKKVYFSQGNLLANYNNLSNVRYSFLDKQYLYEYAYPNYGTSFTGTMLSSNGLMSYIPIMMNDGTTQDGVWRALTAEEWMYLFSYKWDGINSYGEDYDNNTRRDMYRKGVTVMGSANCLVLYPDGYDGTRVQDFDTQSFDTEAEYEAATAAGIVFLPAAGFSFNQHLSDGIFIGEDGLYGAYWSSTPSVSSNNYIYALFFQSQQAKWGDRYVNPKAELTLYSGAALRLVRDVVVPAE